MTRVPAALRTTLLLPPPFETGHVRAARCLVGAVCFIFRG